MLVSTQAIVLSKLRYNDNDLIIKCYTRSQGIKSYLIRNAFKTTRGKFKPAYFQLFTCLDIEANHRDNRSLQYLKEVRLNTHFSTIHTNVMKSTVVMFLSEVLSGILREEEENQELFDFLMTSISWFDENESFTHFHLLFLTELTKYLGCYPDTHNIDAAYFDLAEGRFLNQPTSIYSITGETLTFLKQVLGIKFDVNKKLQMNSKQKQEYLNMILLYFKLHLDGFKEPKSLTVLNDVFS